MDNIFEFYENGFSWVFLLFTFCWGVSGLVREWDGFGLKLANSFLVLGTVILFILMCSDWLDAAIGIIVGGMIALWIGNSISDNTSEEWKGIASIFCFLAFIATFVLYGMGV